MTTSYNGFIMGLVQCPKSLNLISPPWTFPPSIQKVLSTQQPAYLYNLISYHQSSRLLCSSSQSLLHVPRIKTDDFESPACSSAAPQIWNYHIPIRVSPSLDVVLLWLLPPSGTLFLFTFVTVPPYLVSAVNSKLFSISQPSILCSDPTTHPSASFSVVFLRHCALYKFTCLLTYSFKRHLKTHYFALP